MAKEMILVEPSALLFKTSNVPDILEENISNMDREMKRVLDMDKISDYDKARLYEQTLQKYLNSVNKVKEKNIIPQSITQTTKVGELTTNDETDFKRKKFEVSILNSLPKTLREKGRLLLDHLKERTNLSWNEMGEIILNDNKVSNSHISDLLNEALRSRKYSDAPRGWDKFAYELSRTNIPLELIGNKERYRQSLTGHTFETDTAASPFLTPEAEESLIGSSKKKAKRQRKSLIGQTPKKLNWHSYD